MTYHAIVKLLQDFSLFRRHLDHARLRVGATILFCVAQLLSGTTAHAAQSDWVGDPAIGEARLVSAVTATGDLDVLPLGLEFTLAPGWKIYWRTPGEAGLAPGLDFAASAEPDLQGAFRWPLPTRFDAFGFDNFGYANNVILPVDVTGHAKGGFLQIRAEMEALVCADICVPLAGQLALDLPNGEALPSSHAQAMAQFAAMVPRPADSQGRSASAPSFRIAAAESRDNGIFVRFEDGAPAVTDIFVEGLKNTTFKEPVAQSGGFFMPAVPAELPDLEGRIMTLTVAAPPERGAFPVIMGSGAALSAVETQASSSYAAAAGVPIILAALLGGLILNLMPCVLPVLALKLTAVLGVVGASRRELRLRFIAGAAGILSSFILLAVGLLLVRMAGGTVGWGIQFQNPVFLGVMIAMLGLFALSLIDFITLPVPAFAQRLTGWMTAGGGPSPSLRSDFMAGMLATILATPCSAPFVGTAVAAALSGPVMGMFGIFLAMGFGLAAPWLLVAAFPSLVGFLPRPGGWMVWLKRAMAALLMATMIWLGTVLAAVLAPPGLDAGSDVRSDAGSDRGDWQRWSAAEMVRLMTDDRVLFIDVTADWCVTCKANKALVLDAEPVASALEAAQASGDLNMLQADWTRPDPAIAALLAEHGRFGIPFNMIISPRLEAPIILPELLTSSIVIAALEKAGIAAK